MLVTLTIQVTTQPISVSNKPEASGLIDIIASKDGTWNPSLYDNRYRKSEYPSDGDFLQWWYYTCFNDQTQEAWAFCYYIIFSVTNPNVQSGLMFLFSYIGSQGNVQVSYKLDISEFVFLGNYVNFDFGNGKFTQTGISNDIYHLTGIMNDPTKLWSYYITNPNYTENMTFSWDVTLTRLVGCFSQNDVMLQKSPSWNSQAMNTLVSGQITMGSRIITISGNSWRGYGDMNWGDSFIKASPNPENPAKYRWGWIHATQLNSDPTKDFSLIAAFGDVGEFSGITMDIKAVYASVANCLNQRINWKSVKAYPLGLETNLVEECSWGLSCDRFVECSYSADNFIPYVDRFGSAIIPSHQQLILEGEYVKITVDVFVSTADVTRLLTPTPTGIWSNFEALSAIANVKIEQKSYRWYDITHISPIYTTVKTFVDPNAGCEFGYPVAELNFP